MFESFVFGKALENSSSAFDDAILLLLEMLRVYFPAGHLITETQSHSELKNAYLKQAENEADRCSVTLLSRVFSLFNVDLGEGVNLIYKDEHLDYDLALFNTYAATYKR